MKTAIAIPDDLNESIEAFRRRAKMSRSEFFQRAARLYLKTVSTKAIVANLDRIHGSDEASPGDAAFRQASIAHFCELIEGEDS